MKVLTFTMVFILYFAGTILAQNCTTQATGFIPINDLGNGTFRNSWNQVWKGGLYLNGSNHLPPEHKEAGRQLAMQVQPLDANGTPDAINGKIVWLSIGMSNTTQETQQFIPLVNAFPNKNPRLILVDGAQGGQSASVISAPWNANYNIFWNTVNMRLTNAGASGKQVQVIWFKEADQAGNYPGGIRSYYDSMVVMCKRIMNDIKVRFPNAKLCYMASRISARYATTNLNPEPYSYYTGWAVRKVIEDQINGDVQLKYSGNNPKSPWLCWGIYLWSDGNMPQQTQPDVFFSCPGDFNSDGTHPSIAGAKKVASLLNTFFQNDTLSCPWFFKNPPSFCKTTGIPNETDLLNQIDIFPNPCSPHGVLQTNHPLHDATITVENIMGQTLLHKKNISGNTIPLNRNLLPAGLYFLRITGHKELPATKKLVLTD
jgi:hypothetical protein